MASHSFVLEKYEIVGFLELQVHCVSIGMKKTTEVGNTRLAYNDEGFPESEQ